MKKILFYSEGWGLGGIERFIMNTIENLDLNKYSFAIFCTHDWDYTFDSEIHDLGGSRISVFKGFKPSLVLRLLTSPFYYYCYLKKNHFDIVHINTMNGTGFIYARMAQIAGVKKIIVHSHNSAFGKGFKRIKKFVHTLTKLLDSKKFIHLACSREAGKYLFRDHNFEIILNGTNVVKFRYDVNERKEIRKKYDILPSSLVFGTVGRIEHAKNPLFQVEILKALHADDIKAFLLLPGSGSLKNEVQRYAKKYSLEKYVILPGPTTHPEHYYSAMDVMTLPSLFEGFPMSIFEAISCGLPCIVSDAIPDISTLNLPIYNFNIENPVQWAEQINKLNINNSYDSRINVNQLILKSQFSSYASAKKLEQIYM